MSKFIGVDISKQKFDVCFLEENGYSSAEFSNNLKGFKHFLKSLSKGDHVIMEASGPYYLSLACFLHDLGYCVSVVNPLVIKRFCQMRLSRTKTDKKDAFIIASYGQKEKPASWKPDDKSIMQIRQTITVLEKLEKQKAFCSNQLESFGALPYTDDVAVKAIRAILRKLQSETERLEKHIKDIVITHYPDSYKALNKIPGIGPKASILLIALTNNFQSFNTSRQLISYLGLAPRIYESGTSVKGRAHICKMGMSKARKTLYMCTWSAKFYNPQCKELYERLKQKGKPERVIKIAIANKLVRTAFTIGKTLGQYERNYQKKICF